MNPRILTQFALLLLLPAGLSAQPLQLVPESEAPAKVNKALRARVTEFFNYHVGTVGRKAIDLVAKDSKDAYFSSGKQPFKAFTISRIEYFKGDFKRAVVTTDISRDLQIEGQTFPGVTPIATNWKLENGKWFWFLDRERTWINPVASYADNPVHTLGETFLQTGQVAKDFNSPTALADEAQKILDLTKLESNEVTFTIGTPGEARIVLLNGYTGQVDVNVTMSEYPGLTASMERRAVMPKQNGVAIFKYEPTSDPVEPREFIANMRVEPFDQVFPIKVTMKAAPVK
jgi:hypothetical protein